MRLSDKSKRKKIKGFTLAETLITLTIVGIIAILTVPTLISKIRNYAFASKFQKVYTTIANAHNLAIREVDMSALHDTQWYGPSGYIEALMSNLKVAKKCQSIAETAYSISKCYELRKPNKPPYYPPYYQLNGTQMRGTKFDNRDYFFQTGIPFILDDGVFVTVSSYECHKNGNWCGMLYDTYNRGIEILVTVDINGPYTPPNKLGRDVYFIGYNQTDGMFPFGIKTQKRISYKDEYGTDDCVPGGEGYTCAAKIILNKKLNY